MSIQSSTYIFYADVYFIQNFVIKIAVLYLSLYGNGRYVLLSSLKGMGKVILAAFLGTMAEIMALLLGTGSSLILMFVSLFEIPLMMKLILGKEYKQVLRLIFSGYFYVMLINAVLEILWNYFGRAGNYVFFICLSVVGVYIGVRVYENNKKMKKGIYPVEICYHGKIIQTNGFYDSGNHLKDPYTGKHVHIISDKLLEKLSVEKQKEVYIPYQSLGKEQGMILAYYLDYIRIQKERDVTEERDVPVGAAKENLFEGKQYQMILNERIW